MNAMEDKMENQESQVGVWDGRKVEGMTQSAHERQGKMTATENQIVKGKCYNMHRGTQEE